VQTFECADDAEVTLKAAALLDAHPEHRNVEIREGKRKVAHVPRREQSEETLKIVSIGTKKKASDDYGFPVTLGQHVSRHPDLWK